MLDLEINVTKRAQHLIKLHEIEEAKVIGKGNHNCVGNTNLSKIITTMVNYARNYLSEVIHIFL